jgi:hypothetical protein
MLTVHYEAVEAAGNRSWTRLGLHVVTFIHDARSPNPVLLAAIANARPEEAPIILVDLATPKVDPIVKAIFCPQ